MLLLTDDRDRKKTARTRRVLVRAVGCRSRAGVADPLRPTRGLHLTFLLAGPVTATWAGVTSITICLRLDLVRLDLAVVYRVAVQRTNGRLGSLIYRHLDEGKAREPACVAVGNQVDRLDLAILGEQGAQCAFSGVVATFCVMRSTISHAWLRRLLAVPSGPARR
jgi:hypothetical protein